MNVSKLFPYPDQDLFRKVISGKKLQFASPFYSPASLGLIDSQDVETISFITRLPRQYNMPPAFIENDPKPFNQMMGNMGDRLEVYALPELHAKLYLSESGVWVGSSNFTLNGFSGKQEILIQFDCDRAWSKVFSDYRKESTRVHKTSLEKLEKWIDLGLTKVSNSKITNNEDIAKSNKTPFSFEDFVEWLNEDGQPHPAVRRHLFDRVHGKNYMSGHVRAAFNGVLSFLHLESSHLQQLEKVGDGTIPAAIVSDFASFVKDYGDQYRGPRGGRWRNYLSTRLGGVQNSGGAGDTIAKKCLVLMPAYIHAQEHKFG